MLQIYIYGPQEQGFLDLDPGTSLELETLFDAFDEDLSTGEYSLPLEAPWTPWNRRLTGFAERLSNFSINPKEFRCTVYDSMVPEIPIGKMTILEKSGNWTYTKGRFNFSISGGKGLFGSAIKNKKLKSLYFDGPITWQDDESRKFAKDLMMGLYPQFSHISFAPVAMENFFDQQRKDYTDEFLARDCVNNVIVTGAGIDDWTFDRPDPSNPSTPAIGTDRKDYRTIPYFNLMWVFRKVMDNIGYKATGELMNTTDFDHLYIFNNFSLEYYFSSTNLDYNRSIFPANHLPDITVLEFIKAVLDWLNIFPVFPSSNEIKLVYRNSILNNRTILNIGNIVGREFTSTIEDQSTDSNGYKLVYKLDSEDQYYSGRIKDLSDKVLAGSVATYSNLATFDPGYQLTTEHIVFVEADNMYYQVADATVPGATKYDAYAERLGDYIVGDGERTVDIGLCTLATYVEQDATSNLIEKRNYVGCRQTGSYRNYKNAIVQTPFSFRVFYINKREVAGVNIPVSYNHNKNDSNTIIEKYSLSWHGTNGMAQFHAAWQAIRSKTEVLKTTIGINQKVLAELKASNTYEQNNVLFLPFKITRNIPMSNQGELRVVPL